MLLLQLWLCPVLHEESNISRPAKCRIFDNSSKIKAQFPKRVTVTEWNSRFNFASIPLTKVGWLSDDRRIRHYVAQIVAFMMDLLSI